MNKNENNEVVFKLNSTTFRVGSIEPGVVGVLLDTPVEGFEHLTDTWLSHQLGVLMLRFDESEKERRMAERLSSLADACKDSDGQPWYRSATVEDFERNPVSLYIHRTADLEETYVKLARTLRVPQATIIAAFGE